jgi:hypothetical protein
VLYTKGKEALAFADDIGDVAEKLQITGEQLQAVRFAFAGVVDPQQVDGGLTTFTEEPRPGARPGTRRRWCRSRRCMWS